MIVCLQLFQTRNQATRYASQHIWCLFQARINWEGCSSKGIRRNNGGMMEVGHWLVQIEWCPSGWLVCLPCYLPLHHKSPEEDFFWHQLTQVDFCILRGQTKRHFIFSLTIFYHVFLRHSLLFHPPTMLYDIWYNMTIVSEWVSSFLTAHQHIIGHSVP